MKPLNWKKLLNNKCPKCSKGLDFSSDQNIESEQPMIMCTIECGFMISHQKMAEVCSMVVAKKIVPQHLGNDCKRLDRLHV